MSESQAVSPGPMFSPLARCAIVDSRLAAREELKELVYSTDLFEDIRLIESHADALQLIEKVSIDAFFIGPSLTTEGSREFARRAREAGASVDCAYVKCITERNSQADALEGGLIHEVTPWPCTRAALKASTVRAVLRAAAVSPWPGVRLGDAAQILVSAEGEWKVLAGTSWAQDDNPLLNLTGGRDLLDNPESKVEHDAPPVGTLSKERDQEISLLLSDAIGDQATVDLLMVLIRKMNENARRPLDCEHFKQFIMGALEEWQLEMEYGSSKAATKELRRRLSNYRTEFLS